MNATDRARLAHYLKHLQMGLDVSDAQGEGWGPLHEVVYEVITDIDNTINNMMGTRNCHGDG